MLVYITKYATTKGVIPVEATPTRGQDGSVQAEVNGMKVNFRSSQWSPGPAEAAAHARAMRDREIATLERRVAALKAMTFNVRKPRKTAK